MATKKSQPIDGLVLQRKAAKPIQPTKVTTKAERQAAVVKANQPKMATAKTTKPVETASSKAIPLEAAKPSLTNPAVPSSETSTPTSKTPNRKWIVIVVVVMLLLVLLVGILWALLSLA